MTKIAIIGAGLSGLTLAHELKDLAKVEVFDKSRGVGGRLATRRAEPFHFDHGAQFFIAKTDAFSEFLKPLISEGVVAPWEARFVELKGRDVLAKRQWTAEQAHFIGVPSMNGMAKFLAKGLDVRLNTEVVDIKKETNWQLFDRDGGELGEYDWVVSAAPSAQSAKLLPPEFKFREDVSTIKMQGCFALMLGFDEAIPLDFDAAHVSDADISWISVNSSKPGRPNHYCLQIHATNHWAEDHMEDDKEAVVSHLIKEASRVIGYDLNIASHKDLHRWRYANIQRQAGEPCFFDAANQLAACGDWCIEGRVEAAFLSGQALAEKFKANL